MLDSELDISLKKALKAGVSEEFKAFCAELFPSEDSYDPQAALFLPYLLKMMEQLSSGNIPELKIEHSEPIGNEASLCSLVEKEALELILSSKKNPDAIDVATSVGAVTYTILSDTKNPDAELFMRTFVRAWVDIFKRLKSL